MICTVLRMGKSKQCNYNKCVECLKTSKRANNLTSSLLAETVAPRTGKIIKISSMFFLTLHLGKVNRQESR